MKFQRKIKNPSITRYKKSSKRNKKKFKLKKIHFRKINLFHMIKYLAVALKMQIKPNKFKLNKLKPNPIINETIHDDLND